MDLEAVRNLTRAAAFERSGNCCDHCRQTFIDGEGLSAFFYDLEFVGAVDFCIVLCRTCRKHFDQFWSVPGDFSAGIPTLLINRGIWQAYGGAERARAKEREREPSQAKDPGAGSSRSGTEPKKTAHTVNTP